MRLHGVRLPIGLELDEVLVDATQVSAKTDPVEVAMPTPAQVTAVVGEHRLAEYLERQAPGGLTDTQVWLDDDRVFVRGSIQLVLRVPVAISCAIHVVDGRELRVRVLSAEVAGIQPRALVESQIQKANPILDVRDLPIPLILERVEIAAGKLRVFAATSGWPSP
jgi:hypothetical protein